MAEPETAADPGGAAAMLTQVYPPADAECVVEKSLNASPGMHGAAQVAAHGYGADNIPQVLESTRTAASGAGDFSAAFPAYDTGTAALYSHQDTQKRIAIDKVRSDGVTYFVADVWIRDIRVFRTAFARGRCGRGVHEMPATIANDNNAVFAVSGDYYGARDKGLVIRNGTLYRDVMDKDACVLHADGTLSVYQKNALPTLRSIDETAYQAWAFGPALVKDGSACDTSSSKIRVKNPRCAIGYYEPGHYCFIVVDGRQNGYSRGMTLDELADTFVALGCKAAYNLDGGATAMMIFNGQVVSRPVNGGRASSDIICF